MKPRLVLQVLLSRGLSEPRWCPLASDHVVVPVFCMVMDAWKVAPGITVAGTVCIWNAAPLTPGNPLLELEVFVALLLEPPVMLADEPPPTDETVPPELAPTEPALLEDSSDRLLLEAVREDDEGDADEDTVDPDDDDDDDDVDEVLSPAGVPHAADSISTSMPQVDNGVLRGCCVVCVITFIRVTPVSFTWDSLPTRSHHASAG